MKNPFEKKDYTGIIVLLSITAVAAGSVAYLYLTESGTNTRKTVRRKLKDQAKELVSGIISKKTGISKEILRKVADFIVK